MKIPVQYVNDEDGNVKAIQVPTEENSRIKRNIKGIFEWALISSQQIYLRRKQSD